MHDQYDQTRRFISLFADVRQPITFQCLPEPKVEGVSQKKPLYHLPFEEALPHLDVRNGLGYGIFWTPCQFDLPAGEHIWSSGMRTADQATALRVLFVDDDEGALSPEDPRLLVAPPTATVRTKRGWHHYWALEPDQPISAFKETQAKLARHLGTDTSGVESPSKLMRLPGFYHVKAEPVMVTLAQADATRRYTVAGILSAFKLGAVNWWSEIVRQAPVSQFRSQPMPSAPPHLLEKRARSYVMAIRAIARTSGGGDGDTTTLDVARALQKFVQFEGLSESVAWKIFREWNQTNAIPAWNERELRSKFDRAPKYVSTPIAHRKRD